MLFATHAIFIRIIDVGVIIQHTSTNTVFDQINTHINDFLIPIAFQLLTKLRLLLLLSLLQQLLLMIEQEH